MSQQKDTKAWIQAVAQHLNLSLSELAKSSELAPSTVTRYIYDRSGKLGISKRTLDAISAFSGVPYPTMPGQRAVGGFGAPDMVPFNSEEQLDYPGWVTDAVKLAIASRNGVEPWLIKSRALDMLGYLPGDVVLIDQNKRPKSSDIVCAQVTDLATGSSQTVIRRYEPPFIVAHSAKMGPQRPEMVDDERVTIIGVESGLFRASH